MLSKILSVTAEEIARKAFNDMHDNENSWEVYIKTMKEYAHLQIKKDRERVKKLHIQARLSKDAPILEYIENLPIILD